MRSQLDGIRAQVTAWTQGIPGFNFGFKVVLEHWRTELEGASDQELWAAIEAGARGLSDFYKQDTPAHRERLAQIKAHGLGNLDDGDRAFLAQMQAAMIATQDACARALAGGEIAISRGLLPRAG